MLWLLEPSVALCQSLVLAASYLAHIGKPLHSWKYAQSAFSIFQQVRAAKANCVSPQEDDALCRVYWSCFILECDRAAELDLPRSGVETLADDMPLPLSHAENDWVTTAFVAEIAIRRLLNRTHSTLYANRGSLAEDSMPSLHRVASELQSQLVGWYDSIPDTVRPSLEDEGHLSERSKILRLRYYAAMHIIHRPSVLFISDHPELDFTGTAILVSAKTCLYACRRYLHNSSKILNYRTPYL